jgi:hypothetical protein
MPSLCFLLGWVLSASLSFRGERPPGFALLTPPRGVRSDLLTPRPLGTILASSLFDDDRSLLFGIVRCRALPPEPPVLTVL